MNDDWGQAAAGLKLYRRSLVMHVVVLLLAIVLALVARAAHARGLVAWTAGVFTGAEALTNVLSAVGIGRMAIRGPREIRIGTTLAMIGFGVTALVSVTLTLFRAIGHLGPRVAIAIPSAGLGLTVGVLVLLTALKRVGQELHDDELAARAGRMRLTLFGFLFAIGMFGALGVDETTRASPSRSRAGSACCSCSSTCGSSRARSRACAPTRPRRSLSHRSSRASPTA